MTGKKHIIALTRLSPAREADVRELESLCRGHDGTKANAVTDNADNFSRRFRCFYLYYDRLGLAGFLNVFCPDGRNAQISGFVRPDVRLQGIFTALCGAAFSELEKLEDVKITYIAEPIREARAAARAKGLVRSRSELLMRLDAGKTGTCSEVLSEGKKRSAPSEPSPVTAGKCSEGLQENKCGDAVEQLPEKKCDILPPADELRLTGCGGNAVYRFRIENDPEEFGRAEVFFDGSTAFIHDVLVYPDMRGRGLGKSLVRVLTAHIAAIAPDMAVKLHVADTNRRAVHIYREAGFVVEDRRDIYLRRRSSV